MEFSAEMIAGFLGGEVAGDPNAKVNTIVRIEDGAAGGLAFLSNPKYEPWLYTTEATVVIVNRSLEPREAVRATMVRVDDAPVPETASVEVYPKRAGTSPKAAIHETASLGEGCYVGEFAVVAEGVRIGAGCRIYPQVYVGMNVKCYTTFRR